jgi:class 3 adenylate cyclase
LALVLGYGATVVERFMQEQREKRRLSLYFSPNVVQAILRHKEDVNLSSARRQVTVLFSDIRGFTSISEKIPAEEVVAFLREYLTVMTEAVFAHSGTVDKYIGDAIMALYNVPFDEPDHAAHAVRTALAFQERLRPLAARFQDRYGFRIRCGVGIHTGEALVGTMGSRQRLEYTAIGDTINLGARLESLTKDFKVPILVSESTYEAVRGRFLTRFIGEVMVHGRERPVKIYGVDEGEPRGDVRLRVEAGITAMVIQGELRIHASVADLGRGGLSLANLPKEFTQGEVLQLALELPPDEGAPPADVERRAIPTADEVSRLKQAETPRSIEVFARVSWTAKDRAGFQFVDLKADDRAALEAFIGRRARQVP